MRPSTSFQRQSHAHSIEFAVRGWVRVPRCPNQTTRQTHQTNIDLFVDVNQFQHNTPLKFLFLLLLLVGTFVDYTNHVCVMGPCQSVSRAGEQQSSQWKGEGEGGGGMEGGDTQPDPHAPPPVH